MQWRTHATIGVITGLAITSQPLPAKEAIIVTGVSAVAAILPDIDTPRSKAGRTQPFLSTILGLVFGHRGALHSLVACLGVASLFYALAPEPLKHLTKYVGIGYLSHIIADMFTPTGVPLFWPLSNIRARIPLVKTGGWAEKLLAIASLLFLSIKVFTIVGN